ncbi:MAG: dihydroorotase [Oligoflexia bacterium]|nr:dihydroorotase [Oligoflexia bacterium]
MSLTIKNAHLFDPSTGLNSSGSIVIDGGKIIEVIKGKNADSGKVVDAGGQHLMPGFIDLHVHFREPGQENKETIATGSRAAASGGFTTVCAMPNTNPVNDSGIVTAFMMERIRATSVVRTYPIGAISQNLAGQSMAAINGMIQNGCVALSDDGRCVMNAYLLRKTMEYVSSYDIPIVEHCEDENLVGQGCMNEGLVSSQIGLRGIPHAAEDVIVSRDISLSAHTASRLHLAHLSSKGAVEALATAKARGLKVTGEVTPHHLLLTDESLRNYDTNYKMAPPLRTEQDRKALVDALRSGIIDCIATDHAPHCIEDKDVEFGQAANGVIGLETAFATCMKLVEKRELSLERLVESLTASPARAFKFEDRGQLKAGMLADLVIVDPKLKWKITKDSFFSKSSNSPFIGWDVTGRVLATYVDGREVFNLEKGITV